MPVGQWVAPPQGFQDLPLQDAYAPSSINLKKTANPMIGPDLPESTLPPQDDPTAGNLWKAMQGNKVNMQQEFPPQFAK